MADQLCTIAQVKARLFPAGPTDTGDDAMLTEIVEEVSDFIEQYTGRKLVPVTSADYYFDTVAGYVLRVPMGIRAVTFLGVNSMVNQPDTGGTYTTVAASDYLLRPKAQDAAQGWPFTEIHISRGVLAGTVTRFGNIENGAKLTCTAGFAATPPDIASVAIDASVTAYQNRKNGASGVMGSDDAALVPWRNFYGKGSSQRMTLDRYRYWGLG
jgi:hypothetical protein